jgi:hypothetical protein
MQQSTNFTKTEPTVLYLLLKMKLRVQLITLSQFTLILFNKNLKFVEELPDDRKRKSTYSAYSDFNLLVLSLLKVIFR